MDINEKGLELLGMFLKSKLNGYIMYPEAGDKRYKIEIKELSKQQIRRLKDECYI